MEAVRVGDGESALEPLHRGWVDGRVEERAVGAFRRFPCRLLEADFSRESISGGARRHDVLRGLRAEDKRRGERR